MHHSVTRRTFLKNTGQAGSILLAGGILESCLAACGGNLPTTGGNGSSSTKAKISSQGLMRPGIFQWGATADNGAPYVYLNPKTGKLTGFELEIADAIAALMGITQKQVETDYQQLAQSLQANSFDAIMNGWEISDDRKKTEIFSQAYYRNGQQIVVRSDDQRFAKKTENDTLSLKDLDGYTVGTGAGYKAEDLLRADSKITTKAYDPDLPFNDLALGRIDAVLIDYSTVTYYVLGYGEGGTKNEKLKLIGQPFAANDYVIAFNKKNASAPTLQKEIDQALTVLKNNGTLKSIYQKWGLWTAAQTQIGIQ